MVSIRFIAPINQWGGALNNTHFRLTSYRVQMDMLDCTGVTQGMVIER